MKKIILGLLLCLSAKVYATNPVVGYVQVNPPTQQSGAPNISNGSGFNLSASSISASSISIGGLVGNAEVPNVATEFPFIWIASTYTGTANGHGFNDYSTFNPSVNNAAYASFNSRVASGGSNNFDHIKGFQSVPGHYGSGTLTNLYGFYSTPLQSGGPITNMYGLYTDDADYFSGTITNQYGIYVNTQTHGTTNYAIFTAGVTQTEFTGGVGAGNMTAAAIKATVPLNKGLILYCSDCATVAACVSTGTLVNQWAIITNKASACQ